jgi:hypothetical protein
MQEQKNKYVISIQTTSNELTVSNYKVRQTIGEHLGHLKYLNISENQKDVCQ